MHTEKQENHVTLTFDRYLAIQ